MTRTYARTDVFLRGVLDRAFDLADRDGAVDAMDLICGLAADVHVLLVRADRGVRGARGGNPAGEPKTREEG